MMGRIVRIPIVMSALAAAFAALAQIPEPQPGFPPPATDAPPPFATAPQPPVYTTMPAPVPDAFPPAVAVAPAVVPYATAAPRTSIREIFAGTLAAAANVTGVTLVAGLTQAITGGLTNWFSRRTNPQAVAAPAQPAAVPPPVTAGGYAAPAFPQDPATVAATYAGPAYAPSAAAVPPGYAAPDASAGASLYAGIAYEVHAIGADGTALPVDPAAHEFRTGERFVLHYRPALPGRMEVYNVNPAGQQTQIDSAELAAGQLATLGPYEFASLKGDEQLRLVLTPCTRPELVIATRDIVRVSASEPAPGPALGLSTCTPATRSIQGQATRDIRKVALDGSTAFALDPVSAEESRTGRFVPREVTIVFHHR